MLTCWLTWSAFISNLIVLICSVLWWSRFKGNAHHLPTSGEKPLRAGTPGKMVIIGTTIAALVSVNTVICMECLGPSSKETIFLYPPHSSALHMIMFCSAFGAVFAVFCLLFGIHFQRTGDPDNALLWGGNLRMWKAILLAPWVIIPPLWFCMEYFYVYTPPSLSSGVSHETQMLELERKKQSFEEFKGGQENAAKVWLAIVTALAVLYFGESVEKGKEK
jgi:hypothetical protein